MTITTRYHQLRDTVIKSVAKHYPPLTVCLLALWCLYAGAAQALTASSAPSIRFDNPFEEVESTSRQLGGALSIVQDDRGFIWFAGENGVGRYDGRNLKLYQADALSVNGIPASYIWQMAVDHEGVLWQAGEGGLSYYDEAQDIFHHLKQVGGQDFTSEVISALAVAEDNTLYAGGLLGLHAISPDRTQMQVHTLEPPVASGPDVGQVRDLAIDAEGRVWIATAGMGVVIFDPRNKSFEYLIHEPGNSNSLAYNNVRSIMHDDQGRAWLGTYGKGISVLDPSTGHFTHYDHDRNDPDSLAVDIVWDITQDSEGLIWVALDQGGLALFNEDTGGFHHYTNVPYDPQSLPSNQLRVIYEDRNRDLWIGAFPAGVSFYNRSSQVFRHYTARPNDPHSLSNDAILTFLETDDGTIWVGTEGGLNALDPDTGKIRQYLADPLDPSALAANPVLSLAEDPDGSLWVGTWAGGLHRFDRDSQTFTRYPTGQGAQGPNDEFIWSLLLSSGNTLWLGTENGGLNRFHRDTQTFTHFTHRPDSANTISGNYIPALLEDDENRIWVGSFTGVDIFNPETGAFTHTEMQGVKGNDISSQNIRSLYEDSQGRIWVGTQHRGVHRLDKAGNIVDVFNMSNGLPSANISSILEDTQGAIWLATANGIARLDPDSGAVNTYSREDGLAGSHYNRDATLRDSRGQLWFGSTDGITVFNPEELNRQGPDFPVVITNLRILNREVPIGTPDSPLQKSILLTDEFTLTHEDTMFSFDFAALNYRQSNIIRYSYRLEGFDRDWNNIGRIPTATYTNINPGNYRFRTRASVNGETWVEGQSLAITILPPPWRSWWAYLIYLGIFAVLLWFAHKYITLQVRAEAYRSKSMTDPLTQLYNRAGIAQVSEGVFANATTKKGMCLMIMDIDHFKRINDRRGHDAGDRILCDVSRVVRDCLRNSDHFGRWGGEEFILMCATHGRTSSHFLAEKVRKAVEAHTYEQHSRRPVHISVSIGVADLLPDDTFESALKRADNALYKAKELGRNCVVMAE